jgi:hypothetical protein
MNAGAAFLLFQLRVGTRLALRILAPILAAILFSFYILRPEFMLALARALFIEGSLAESGVAGTLLLLGIARAVTPRISAGRAGWARSLPAKGRVLRALEILSSIVGAAPLLAVLGALAWAVARPDKGRIALQLAGLLVGAAAASFISLQGPTALKRKLLPAVACFLSFSGNVILLIAAAAVLVLAVAGPGDAERAGKRRRPLRSLPSTSFFCRLSLRAAGARIVLAYIPAAIVLGAGWLFLENNELAANTAFSLSLFSLTLGLAVFIGLAADALAARRPAWPWLRSLPLSAAARIGSDALFLGLHALPVASGLALLGRPAWEAAFLAGPIAWFALRAAGAMREAAGQPFGVLGKVLVEGTIISLSLAVLPWLSGVLVAVAPVAFVLARNAERRLKPSLWAARHHMNTGDPLSWSAL